MTDQSTVTAMAGDVKSQTLAAGNSNGCVIIFDCDNQSDWIPKYSIKPSNEIPVTTLGTLNRVENLYVVGFANGMVKLIKP